MSKTIAKGETHQATSTDIALDDLNITVALPPQATRKVATQDSAAASEEDVRVLAHAKWEAAGCPSGDGVGFWLEAERELMAKSSESNSGEG